MKEYEEPNYLPVKKVWLHSQDKQAQGLKTMSSGKNSKSA